MLSRKKCPEYLSPLFDFFFFRSAFMNELHDMSCMTCYMKFDFTLLELKKKLCRLTGNVVCAYYLILALSFATPVSLTVTVFRCSSELVPSLTLVYQTACHANLLPEVSNVLT